MTRTAGALPPLGQDEQRLVLACGRLTFGEEQADVAARLLRGALSWDAILVHARFHSIAPLVYRNLDRIGAWTAAPDRVRRGLLELAHRAAYQNRAFARENAAILDAFHEAEIPAIIQKGISLVELVYGSLTIRPLIDLVFLVPHDRLADAARTLARNGYTARRATGREMFYRWSCPQIFLEAAREIGVAVLLQSDLVNWPRLHRLAVPPLFERAQRAQITGRPALVLAPEDQILYLCLQADNHGTFNRVALDAMSAADLVFTPWTNNRQIRFVDIFETAKRLGPEVDWETLVGRAIDAGVEEAALASLSLTNDLLGTVAPADVVKALRRPRRNRLRRWLFLAAAPDAPAPARPRSRFGLRAAAHAAWHALTPGSQVQAGRIVGLIEFCFPEPEQLRLRYGPRPRPLVPFVYAAHAGHGVVRSFWAYASRRAAGLAARAWKAVARPHPAVRHQRAQE